jgi:hypothetical protein
LRGEASWDFIGDFRGDFIGDLESWDFMGDLLGLVFMGDLSSYLEVTRLTEFPDGFLVGQRLVAFYPEPF